MSRLFFKPGDLIDVWPQTSAPTDPMLCGGPPSVVRAEFTIAQCGDVDPRCACRFVEFDEGGGAVFAWNKACATHPKLPGGGVALW